MEAHKLGVYAPGYDPPEGVFCVMKKYRDALRLLQQEEASLRATPRKPLTPVLQTPTPVLGAPREPSASSSVGRPPQWLRRVEDTAKEAKAYSKPVALPALQRPRCVTSIVGDVHEFCAFGEKLGEGGGGVVSEVITQGFPVQLCGKAVKKSNNTSAGHDGASWRKIAEVLLNISHPHIVQLHEVIEDDKMIYTVMERCHGTLLIYIGERRRLPLATVRVLGQQVISAVVFLHSKGILHRDLKPENILMVNEGQEVVKIADFDLCAFIGEDGLFISSTVQGTGGFLAPEAIAERRYSVQSDLFAFGCVLHFILFRQLALGRIRLEKGTDPKEVAAKTIAEAESAIKCSQEAASGGAHAEARQLINSCLSVDPLNRPRSAMEAARHEFLASQDSRKGLKGGDANGITKPRGKYLSSNAHYVRFLPSFRSPTSVAS